MGPPESVDVVPAGAHLDAEIRAALPVHLLTRIRAFDTVDSTNSFAQRNADDLPVGTVLVADHQTGGRGRMGRSWHSRPGASLLLSYVSALRGNAVVDRLYPLAASVAVCRAVRLAIERAPASSSVTHKNVTIKWPNDIEYKGAKLAGILINSITSSKCVIGVGVNVSAVRLPSDLRQPAVSLDELSSVGRMELLVLLIQTIDDATGQLDGGTGLVRDYRTKLGHVGKRVRMQHVPNGQPVEGVFAGVRDDGAALIETDAGVLAFHAGDLTSVPHK